MRKKASYSPRPCTSCGATFKPETSSMKFCSLPCRFWSHVDKKRDADCWEWTKAITTSTGYGNITITPGNQEATHRLAFKLSHGEIPAGMYVCHKCDNRKCCNPAHLYLGTPQDNARDMWVRGRQHNYSTMEKGVDRHNARLNEEKVIYIRANFAKRSATDLARQFGVSVSTVIEAAKGITWKHVVGVGEV